MSIQSALAEIRMRCVAQMFEDLPHLRQLRDALEQSGDVSVSLAELHLAAHKSAGISATLGFSRLGKVAQTLDRGLADCATSGQVPLPVLFLLDEYLSEMSSIIEAEACTLGIPPDQN